MIGEKHDDGKPRWDLMPWIALESIIGVLTYGAKKYAAHQWRDVPELGERYWAATHRHLAAFRGGELIDPESGYPHLAHACCSILFLLTIELERDHDQKQNR
jgi:hypothetical protein